MKKAILTSDGAYRLNRQDLYNKEVEYDYIDQNGIAKNIYYKGKRIAGILSTKGEDRGLAPKETR